MKTAIFALLLSAWITAQTYHTISIDGVNDFTVGPERSSTTSGTTLYGYVTWDATYIYIGFSGNSPAGPITDYGRVIHLYIDTDPKQSPKTGNGTSAGESWRFTPALSFNADYHYAFKTSDNSEYKRIYSGGTWQNTTITTSNWKAAGYWEIRIERAGLGNPKQINFLGYIEEDWSSGFICGGLPSGLFTNNNSGGAITFNNKYLHFNLIDQITPNSSFHNENFSWLAGLRISGASLADTSYAGMAGNATDSIDSGTDLVLGSMPADNYLEIYFKHTWGNDRYSRYINLLTDISASQKIWNLEAATDRLNTTITITPELWPGIPSSYAVKLRDVSTGDVTDLRTSSYSYTTGSSAEVRQFQLIIGLDGPAVQFTYPSLGFGNVQLDNVSELSNYVKNTGIASLNVSSVSSNSSNFTVVSSGSFTLAPGDSAAVTIKFRPEAVQSYSGSVSVASNAAGSPSAFSLSGTGIQNTETIILPAGWNLISVPVTPASSVASAVFGDDADYFLLYSYSDGSYSVPAAISRKTGYWFGLNSADTIDAEGTAQTANDSILLSQGWNLIGNPFIRKFAVSDVRYRKDGTTLTPSAAVTAGWIQNNFTKYASGSYASVSDSLAKWGGYFFYTLLPGVSMLFDRSMAGNREKEPSGIPSNDSWLVPIAVSNGTSEDRYLSFGTEQGASAGFDNRYDYLKPPPVPSSNLIESWFSIPGRQEKFSRDVREPLTSSVSGHSWSFSLRTPAPGIVTISWESIASVLPDYIKENYSFNLTGASVNSTDMLSVSSVAFAADANTVYEFNINPVPTDISGSDPVLSEFSLEQNYPNPFNPGTVIRFSLPESGPVTLKLYDTKGSEVRTIFNGYQNYGYHSVYFNAAELPSGVYFYRLEAGSNSMTKKLLIMR